MFGSAPPVPSLVVPLDVDARERTVVWVADASVGVASFTRRWSDLGTDAVRTHRGPLAAVLRDRDGSVVLVTDPLGTLALFWAWTDRGELVVSTSIAALVDRDDVDERYDYVQVAASSGTGLRGAALAHRTRFRAVSVVPAGHVARCRPGGRVHLELVWSPAVVEPVDTQRRFSDCVALLRTRIDEAVRIAVDGEERVGAHVSGGLDCTAVACRAHQVLGEQHRALVAGYSWAPDEQSVPRFRGDERDLLDDVTAMHGFTIRHLDRRDPSWWHRRDPNRYPASTHVAERHAIGQAHDDGVTLLLSGWGGDELASFNGRGVWHQLIRSGRLGTVARLQRQQRSTTSNPASPLVAARDLLAVVAHTTEPVSSAVRRPLAAIRAHRADRERLAELRAFAPELADAAADNSRRFADAATARGYQEALLANGHLQHRIQAWQQVGARFGVRYRYPLLDVGVVEAALTMPWWAWRHEGWARAAYRAAVAPWVPASVAWNLRKVEPAFLFRPGAAPVDPEIAPPDAWATDDPTYAAAQRLGVGPHRERRPAVTAADRVAARPDLAL